jgi:spore coat protein H
MNRVYSSVVMLVALFGACACVFAQEGKKGKVRDDDFLTPTALHSIHLHVSKADWRRMEPPSGLLGRMWQPQVKEEDLRHSQFGFEFAWVTGSFEYGLAKDKERWTRLPQVGMRFKGNSSYAMAQEVLKRPLKVDFDRVVKGQSFAGLTQINLHNNAFDPSHMREALSYWVFQEAGAPASRTAYALVYVTVDGVHDRKLAGLYTVVEEVDKTFLASRFGTGKGLLLKPEAAFDLAHLGEEFSKYEKVYRPKTGETPETAKALIEFTRLIHKADDATFEREIEKRLDVDAFLRFVACNAVLSNMDSFLSTGHNFYMYVHPETLKVYFMPWDMNLSLGGFDWVGNAEEQVRLSLRKPYVGKNSLIARVLKIPRYEARYREITSKIVKEVFTSEKMNQKIDRIEAVIAMARERALGGGGGGKGTTRATTAPVRNLAADGHWAIATPPDVRDFATRRAAAAARYLVSEEGAYEPFWVKSLFGRVGEKKGTTKPSSEAKK